MNLALLLVVLQAAARPSPPPQPESGPGGRTYAHARVEASGHGEGGESFWIFAPAEPAPETAPVVVFLHGWGGMDPAPYRVWIDHLVRRGNLVVYPRYQASLLTPPGDFLPNTIAAIRDALRLLGSKATKPDLEKVAAVGHSAGGHLAANLAAVAAAEKLPRVRAAMPVEPGTGGGRIPTSDLGKIPPETLVLLLVGVEDVEAGNEGAIEIWNGISQVPLANRDFTVVRSDRRGDPPLLADHYFPLAPEAGYASPRRVRRRPPGVDALDHLATWRVLDLVLEAAFSGKSLEAAISRPKLEMGRWSDGEPVVPIDILDEPPPLDPSAGFWSRRAGTVPPAAEEEPAADAEPPARGAPRVIRNLAYHEGADFDEDRHRLDLHLPAEGKDFPVILFLHGGAWTMGAKEWYGSSMANVARPFVEAGIGVAMANYRLSPAVRHPEHARDAARAFAWLRAHVAEYGGDPENLFLMGHSAGGHLAALLGVNDRFLEGVGASTSQIRGVIPVSGIFEIERGGPRFAFGTDPEARRDASPAAFAKGKHPPFFLTVGEFDMGNLRAQAERFRDALRAGGTTVEYLLQRGKGHVAAGTDFEKEGNEAAAAIVAFVKRNVRR